MFQLFHVSMVWKRFQTVSVSVMFCEIWELSGNKNALGMLHVSLLWVRFQKVELVADKLKIKQICMSSFINFHLFQKKERRFQLFLKVSLVACKVSLVVDRLEMKAYFMFLVSNV